MFYLFVSGVHS